MKLPKELSKAELVEVVERIQCVAFINVHQTLDEVLIPCWAPDRALGADVIGDIVEILDNAGLKPEQEGRAECAACGQGPIKPDMTFCGRCSKKAGRT